MNPEPVFAGADAAGQLARLGIYLALGLGGMALLCLLLRRFHRRQPEADLRPETRTASSRPPFSRAWRAGFWLTATASAGCVLWPALSAVRQLYPLPGLGPWLVGLATGAVVLLAGGWLVAWLSGSGRPDP